MNFIPHQLASGALVAEIEAEGIVMGSLEEALQVLGDAYYNDFDRVMVRVEQLNPDFFDLSTGLAGEILQKFAQYRMGLIIVGDFSQFPSASLAYFIRESNKGQHIRFVSSLEEVVK